MPHPRDGAGEIVLHASAVAIGRRGLLITGASGTGKSTVALQLVGLGATLVADDRVLVTPHAEGGLHLSCPEPIRGMIEARGVGLLRTRSTEAIAVAVVDLDRTETDRLPEAETAQIAGQSLPLIKRVEGPAFPSILLVYLKGGMEES